MFAEGSWRLARTGLAAGGLSGPTFKAVPSMLLGASPGHGSPSGSVQVEEESGQDRAKGSWPELCSKGS